MLQQIEELQPLTGAHALDKIDVMQICLMCDQARHQRIGQPVLTCGDQHTPLL